MRARGEREKEEFRIINNSVYIIEGAKAHYKVGCWESAHEKTNTKK